MNSSFPVSNCRGVSLIEVVSLVAVLGILSGICMTNFGKFREASEFSKLQTDVLSVNSSIRIYLASGGDLAGLAAPQAVLDKLKTRRSSEAAALFAGLDGSMIDKRVFAEPLTGVQIESDKPRAVWNAVDQRFDIKREGPGVKAFRIEDSLATIDFGEEDRERSAIDHNPGDGWIWTYEDSDVLASLVATTIPLPGGGTGSSGIPTPPVPPIPPIPPGPPIDPGPTTPSLLLPPLFSPPGGIYPESAFDLAVTIINPNPQSTSWIMVSVNGSAFANYSGSLTVGPDSYVTAYVTGDPSLWDDSSPVTEVYEAVPAPSEAIGFSVSVSTSPPAAAP